MGRPGADGIGREPKKNQWHWIINLHPWIGRKCQIETVDGCYRKGLITGVQLNVLSIDGRTVYLPISVELNNDSTDRMEFHRFKSFSMEQAEETP